MFITQHKTTEFWLKQPPQAAHDAWQQALTILDDLDHSDAAQVRAKLAGLDPSVDPLQP